MYICEKCNEILKVKDCVRTKNNETLRSKICPSCNKIYYTIEFEADGSDDIFKKDWCDNHRSNSKNRKLNKKHEEVK